MIGKLMGLVQAVHNKPRESGQIVGVAREPVEPPKGIRGFDLR